MNDSAVQARGSSGRAITGRKRVSQACDRCRSRKDKCDGKRPTCSSCASFGQVCSYEPVTKKRGLPEGYVRGLEKLWGLAIQKATGVESTILSLLSDGSGLGGRSGLIRIWADSDALVDIWRKSNLCRELDRLQSVDVSEEKFKRKRADTITDSESEPPSSIPKLGAHHLQPETTIRASVTSAPLDLAPKIHIRPLPSNAWQLIDIYFTYTHCWLPIMEKHDLLRVFYQYSQNEGLSQSLPISPITTRSDSIYDGKRSNGHTGEHAALWAVLSYAGMQKVTTSESTSNQTIEEHYKQARALIPAEDAEYELGHIQAMMILALCNIGNGRWDTAWLLLGRAARICIVIGLDKSLQINSSDYRADVSRQPARSKHVLLGCFVLDTLVSARLARHPQLRSSDVDSVGPLDEGGLEEWDPWTGNRSDSTGTAAPLFTLSTFNRLIQVLQVLNDISCDTSVGTVREELCDMLIQKLRTWNETQPPQSRLTDHLSLQPRNTLPHHFNLHLAHVTTLSVLNSHSYVSRQSIENQERRNPEPFAQLARKAAWLLKQYSNYFALSIVPPTFEYFTTIACDGANVARDGTEQSQITNAELKEVLYEAVAEMGKSWSVFEVIKASFYNFSIPQESEEIQQQPTVRPSPRDTLRKESANELAFQSNTPMSQGDLWSHPLISPASNQLSLVSPGNEFLLGQPISTGPRTGSLIEQDLADSTPKENQLTPMMMDPFGSDLDGDSAFNEFATIDAMKWSDNWEQSLLNLGFNDASNMNQDFAAFCNPDSLFDTTLSSVAPMNLPPFAGEAFMDSSDSHLEASQILQGLSASARLPWS